MALLSLNNLTAPLTNKVHLATIFLACLVFVVLRLSSGSLEVRDLSDITHTAPQRRATAEQEAERLLEQRRIQQQAASSQHKNADLLESMVRSPVKSQDPQMQPGDRNPSKADSLDEIEKTLGLR